jgi:predicted membrane-bound spermidine synthase
MRRFRAAKDCCKHFLRFAVMIAERFRSRGDGVGLTPKANRERHLGIPGALRSAFVVSGVAGLVYEVLWSRYLGLYVGHSAYAQVLVLAVYLGGMAVGSIVLADLSRRVRRPLLWYVGAECALAAFGLAFHPLFQLVSTLSYDMLFPAIGSAGLVGSLRWGLAGALILPQAMVLGATFPLMAAALVRADPASPGRGVATVYTLNTLGGAAGVLLAGFWMIGALGLPGTSTAAAGLNLLAAGLALSASRKHARGEGTAGPAAPGSGSGDDGSEMPAPDAPGAAAPDSRADPSSTYPSSLTPVLLVVSFATALASFAYEIGWIRMLSLVLGSATHSFELMLSAFILGLAGGAWLVRDRADLARDPLRLLGVVQVLMGLAALASLPLFYAVSFDVMAWLVRTLPGRDGGYALFNLGRYGLSLVVMLPATVLAGMTLPVIIGTLLRAGAGESAIGRVYGVNTIGSVAGAATAGLVALPWLGLKGLVMAGAALDVLLGIWMLERSARWAGGTWRLAGACALASAFLFTGVGFGLTLDGVVMASGVYRYGDLPREGDRIGLYYADGRTATVSAHLGTANGVITLATNGKPDASIAPRWLSEGRDTLPVRPIEERSDFTTQSLAPVVGLAYRPDARNAANIGHGSGMSATALLTSERLERLVTIEIEPLMVQGSLVFLPANEAALADPRSVYVFDDAKSYFSYRRERFDIVFAEPSNPWVSGTASLFSVEFYRQVTDFIAEGGVLAQWMQIYELSDELFLSVVAALDAVFPSYRAYLVGDADVAIVASPHGPLGEPDWSVLESAAFQTLTGGAPPFRAEHMEALFLFDETTLRPLLRRGVRANSDFRPVLDLGAERARFERVTADGARSFGVSRVDLARILEGDAAEPLAYHAVPAYGLAPAVLWGRGAWLRDVMASGGGIAPEEFPEWQSALVGLQGFLAISRENGPPASWEQWAMGFESVEADLHWGTVGWVDADFYSEVYGFLDRAGAPAEARAAVDLKHGLGLLEWERAARAADLLVSRVAGGERWVPPSTLLDVAVVAYLRVGRPTGARNALNLLGPRSGRSADHLRNRLLDALISEAEAEAAR